MKQWIARAALGAVAAGLVVTAQSGSAAADVTPMCSTGWRGAVASYTSYAVSKSNCGWMTSTSSKNPQHRRYKWAVQAGTNSRVCVQVQGHTWSPSARKTVARWYKAGCGTSGTVLVPWHAQPTGGGGYYGIIAYPEVRAKIQPGFLGGEYRWT